MTVIPEDGNSSGCDGGGQYFPHEGFGRVGSRVGREGKRRKEGAVERDGVGKGAGEENEVFAVGGPCGESSRQSIRIILGWVAREL